MGRKIIIIILLIFLLFILSGCDLEQNQINSNKDREYRFIPISNGRFVQIIPVPITN